MSAIWPAPNAPDTHGLIGQSAEMAEVRAAIAGFGPSEAPVLITGPSGSGKELAARALHAAGPRATGPFVAVNCGAIPRELLESELFGHERGAFTGAHAARVGKFEAAAGGTLFLDEIGDMPLDMQVALLRVLEERRFERVGSTRSQPADVRIVSATHRDLVSAIENGRFREDLFYRLNVLGLDMPSLAARAADVPALLACFTARLGARAPVFSDSAIARLCAHDWPGNVRELRNFVERAAVRYQGVPLSAAEAEAALARNPRGGAAPAGARAAAGPDARWAVSNPLAAADGATGPTWGRVEPASCAPASAVAAFGIEPGRYLLGGAIDLRAALGDLERGFIEAALARSGDVVATAARALKMQRTTLVEKMRRLDVRRALESPEDADASASPAA